MPAMELSTAARRAFQRWGSKGGRKRRLLSKKQRSAIAKKGWKKRLEPRAIDPAYFDGCKPRVGDEVIVRMPVRRRQRFMVTSVKPLMARLMLKKGRERA